MTNSSNNFLVFSHFQKMLLGLVVPTPSYLLRWGWPQLHLLYHSLQKPTLYYILSKIIKSCPASAKCQSSQGCNLLCLTDLQIPTLSKCPLTWSSIKNVFALHIFPWVSRHLGLLKTCLCIKGYLNMLTKPKAFLHQILFPTATYKRLHMKSSIFIQYFSTCSYFNSGTVIAIHDNDI